MGGLPQTICHAKVCGRPHPANTKIARQRHKNKNFEKNGTYIKDSVALSVPTNFFEDPTKFGDRIKKKQKRPFTSHVGWPLICPRHFVLFGS